MSTTSYYWRNHDKVVERLRQRRQADPEKYRAQRRSYRQRNREKLLERERAYYRKNAQRILDNKRESQRYRARIYYWQRRFNDDPSNWQQLQEAKAEYETYKRRKDMSTASSMGNKTK